MLGSIKSKPHRLNCSNLILRSLPENDLTWLLPQLERVPLRQRGIVQFNNDSMNHVYFVEKGLISVLADTGRGKSIETRMIGPEGFVGVRVALGKRESCHRRIVQVAGSALRIEADRFATLLKSNDTLNAVMLEYVHAVMLQASQLSACNAHHDVRQRLARWLLMAQDRCGTNSLAITHKMMSRVLGVRRATVSDCIAILEREGIIERSARSLVRVADRKKLAAVSCQCYRQISSGTGDLGGRLATLDG